MLTRISAKVPEPARTTLSKLRVTIGSVVPSEATEQLSYGMPAFHYKGALVAYAAFKPLQFLSYASFIDGRNAGRTEELSKLKGTLQFPLDKPLPATL